MEFFLPYIHFISLPSVVTVNITTPACPRLQTVTLILMFIIICYLLFSQKQHSIEKFSVSLKPGLNETLVCCKEVIVRTVVTSRVSL